MRAPVDGLAGAAWRTVTLPTRLVAPTILIARRVVARELWVERVHQTEASGPTVALSGDGDSLQPPEQGVGPLNHRVYQVKIEDSQISASDLIEAFRCDPNRFSPTSYATFAPDPAPQGLEVGDRLDVKLPGPWNGPILVAIVDNDRVRVETLKGHLEAGWIEFSARQTGDLVEFRIESYARSGDSLFDLLYHRIGIAKLFQTETWVQVLESAVSVSGGSQVGRIEAATTIYEGSTQ